MPANLTQLRLPRKSVRPSFPIVNASLGKNRKTIDVPSVKLGKAVRSGSGNSGYVTAVRPTRPAPETSMDLEFRPEDLAFRDEVRSFLEKDYPKELRGK